nr:MAG TPA: hypothetical protein [Caudoviricetes sp.]
MPHIIVRHKVMMERVPQLGLNVMGNLMNEMTSTLGLMKIKKTKKRNRNE